MVSYRLKLESIGFSGLKEIQEEFARTFLDSAPSECFVNYRNSLRNLGFRYSEIDLQANNLLALARN